MCRDLEHLRGAGVRERREVEAGDLFIVFQVALQLLVEDLLVGLERLQPDEAVLEVLRKFFVGASM